MKCQKILASWSTLVQINWKKHFVSENKTWLWIFIGRKTVGPFQRPKILWYAIIFFPIHWYIYKIWENGTPHSLCQVWSVASLTLCKFFFLLSTAKLILGRLFAQFLLRFKIEIFECCSSWTSQFFPIHERWNWDFWMLA